MPGDLLRVFERAAIARTRRRESARPVSRRPAGSTLWKSAAVAASRPASAR